jgi:uncharacterized protein YndB with AHSA1/START domain
MNRTHNPTIITAPKATPFLEIVREFDAPRDRVFRAAVDPELVVRWLGPRDRQMRIDHWDPRSGGSYRYLMAGDDDFSAGFRGVYHTVRPDELVIQSFEYEGFPDQVALETVTYEGLDGGRTRVRTWSVFPSVEARDGAIASGMERGVVDSMERLDELLDAG